MITTEHLSKRFGSRLAVDDVSFTARAGRVTGFLGPNGAGKSTTMRLVVGLDRPTSGRALVNGRPYVSAPAPLHEVGALLDARPSSPELTARAFLRVIAATHGIPARRVDEVLGITGIESVAGKRVRGFSLGMGQRLGIAAALLGDPGVLLLDEPVNGLDPDGVRWIRDLVQGLAAEGRTVLLSSHLMSETAMVADDLVLMGRGRIIASSTMQDFVAENTHERLRVRADDVHRLGPLVAAAGGRAAVSPDGALLVEGLDARSVAALVQHDGQSLLELAQERASLEDAYVAFTRSHVEFETETAA